MKKSLYLFLVFVILASATVVGVLVGKRLADQKEMPHRTQLAQWHQFIHEKLSVSVEQEQQLKIIELEFDKKREKLHKQILKVNKQLAYAVSRDGHYSKEVEETLQKNNRIMGEIQTLTIQHFFDMQAVLNEEQKDKFESMVLNALGTK